MLILELLAIPLLAGALAWLVGVVSERPRSSIRRSQRASAARTPCTAGSTGKWSRSRLPPSG